MKFEEMLDLYCSSGLAILELYAHFVDDDEEGSSSDGEGPENAGGAYSDFTPYAPLPNMHNVDLHAEGGLEFPKLPHRRSGHARFSLNVSDLQVGIEFSLKDAFVCCSEMV
ncbi:hypothetical protein J1N35_002037 [Gossypium stocksii]|uniref:Uncharacterized protein n=1 Tax=Gossypium stocksii TaxID=47602 RepID=A0A9D3WK99_9ROSI|nr:hypothetical protein J1N35_002037 [Gossypium stocksii]